MQLPAFPAAGPLRPLAIGATLALVGFAIALIAAIIRRDRRAIAWTAAALSLGALTVALGVWDSALHDATSVLAVAIALRNAIRMQGVVRYMSALGATGWIVAMVAARMLFGPG